MGEGLTKTLVCLIFIGIGMLMKYKITSKEQKSGIKLIILSLALPATIFIALLKIKIELKLLILPLAALAINLIMFGSLFLLLRILGISRKSPKGRTILLLTASMAPGLSCFPFVMEYLGDQCLAYAAFADVGNKFYGLLLLYLLAMHWYFLQLRKNSKHSTVRSGGFKSLVIALVKEPINIVLVVGLIMLVVGLDFGSLPDFSQNVLQRLSLIMTPLVLIFIGLAVRVNRKAFRLIVQVLFWKSGIAFIISGLVLLFAPATLTLPVLLLIVAFPQSACSFWPFAHMTAVKSLEKGIKVKTFNLKLALNILAFSLPFSTVLILIICSSGATFSNAWFVIFLGACFLAVPIIAQFLTGKTYQYLRRLKQENLIFSD